MHNTDTIEAAFVRVEDGSASFSESLYSSCILRGVVIVSSNHSDFGSRSLDVAILSLNLMALGKLKELSSTSGLPLGGY